MKAASHVSSDHYATGEAAWSKGGWRATARGSAVAPPNRRGMHCSAMLRVSSPRLYPTLFVYKANAHLTVDRSL